MARWGNEHRWDGAISAEAAKTGVPVWVIKATIGQESSFNPQAFRNEPAIGDASRGLMQLLYKTARSLGYVGPAGDDATRTGGLYEPETSIRFGAVLLAQLQRRFPGEPWQALYAAYNSGGIRRNERGEFTNSKGLTNGNQHVVLWIGKANYFRELEGMPPLPLPGAPVPEAAPPSSSPPSSSPESSSGPGGACGE